MLFVYVIASGLMAGGRYKYESCYEAIVFVYVVQLCLEAYLINPFDVTNPREFLYWSVIITLRCCLLETVFGVNGIYDAAMSVFAPGIAIFSMTYKLEFEGD